MDHEYSPSILKRTFEESAWTGDFPSESDLALQDTTFPLQHFNLPPEQRGDGGLISDCEISTDESIPDLTPSSPDELSGDDHEVEALWFEDRNTFNRERHSGRISSGKPNQYYCDVQGCVSSGKPFKRKYELKRHKRKQHDDDCDRYICGLCQKENIKKDKIIKHLRSIHGISKDTAIGECSLKPCKTKRVVLFTSGSKPDPPPLLVQRELAAKEFNPYTLSWKHPMSPPKRGQVGIATLNQHDCPPIQAHRPQFQDDTEQPNGPEIISSAGAAALTLPISSNSLRRLSRTEYTVGWICALPKETVPSLLMLDEEHEPKHGGRNDNNTYYCGRMGRHNVVIACFPSGACGETHAAVIATNMSRSFTSIKFCLVVGIAAGIASEGYDIRLGDVVVGVPKDQLGGVVQYDFGREDTDNTFTRRGCLNKPPPILLSALTRFDIDDRQGRSKIPNILANARQKPVKHPDIFKYPGANSDYLFEPNYGCQSSEHTLCVLCDKGRTIPRRSSRLDCQPVVHYGIIASGNRLVRSPDFRDKLMKEHKACCIVMEAAGIITVFPCLVIRGISDYADSHKNDQWQDYAALTAAACAREILDYVMEEEFDTIGRPDSPINFIPKCEFE